MKREFVIEMEISSCREPKCTLMVWANHTENSRGILETLISGLSHREVTELSLLLKQVAGV